MIAPNGFVRRNTDGYGYDSICLHCFLTVSAVEGGANLREMEMRHKCDPMTMIHPSKAHEVVVSIDEGFAEYLFEDRLFDDFMSEPDTTEADQEKILLRLRKYGRKQGLSIIRRAGSRG
jgi:hypothetical protein